MLTILGRTNLLSLECWQTARNQNLILQGYIAPNYLADQVHCYKPVTTL